MIAIRAQRIIPCIIVMHGALTWPAVGQTPDRAALVATLGTDTIAVDRFTRTRDRLEGDLLVRSPRTQIIRYAAMLDNSGAIARLDASVRQPDGTELQHIVMDFTGDSITTEITGRRATSVRAPRAAGAVPLPALPNSFYALGFFEHAMRQGVPAGTTSFEVPWIVVGGRGAFTTTVKRLGGDTLEIGFFAGPMIARTDAAGRLLWLSGRNSTVKIEVERVADIAIGRLATEFSARDAAGRGLGNVSPPDSVVSSTAGVQIRIRYSRPSKRGRAIFGGIVPWNEMWRAGANAATSFVTDRDLDMGGTTVPAGAYTLYLLPSPDRTELIISTQTGQWGTVYDASRDLVRIPLHAERLRDVTEMFTIAVTPRNGGGQLSFAWDRTRFSVPFTVR